MTRWIMLVAVLGAGIVLHGEVAHGQGQESTLPSAAQGGLPGELPGGLPGGGEVLAGAQTRAIQEILAASRSDSAQFRATAVEAMAPLPDRVLPIVQMGLKDPNPAVRFAALTAVGYLGFDTLGSAAVAMIGDPDPSVRAAAMYAADACGLRVNMSELPLLLTSRDPGVRGNAAMICGLMGNASAVPMLKEAARTPLPMAQQIRVTLVHLQIAEALVRLGDEQEIEPIRAKMYSQEYEVRIMAVMMLGELEDRRMIPAVANLMTDQPVEMRVAAAQALAKMGRVEGLPVLLDASAMTGKVVADQARVFMKKHPQSPYVFAYRQLINNPEGLEQVASGARAQSAFGLAEIDDPWSATALVRLLDDPSPTVRLSAAAGILRGLHPLPPRKFPPRDRK